MKIRGGTANESRGNLCRSCRTGQVVRKGGTNEEIVHCHALERRIVGNVAECNRYDNANNPTLHGMKEIAWHVSADGPRGAAGFKVVTTTPRQRKEKGEHDMPLVTPDGDVYY